MSTKATSAIAEKPYEVQVNPRAPAKQDRETLDEMNEEMASQAQIRARQQVRRDKVGDFLGEKFWVYDKTWPCLLWPITGRQLSVSMFFPRINVAIDKYPNPSDIDRREAQFKAEQLQKAGVRYKALFPETPLSGLARLK